MWFRLFKRRACACVLAITIVSSMFAVLKVLPVEAFVPLPQREKLRMEEYEELAYFWAPIWYQDLAGIALNVSGQLVVLYLGDWITRFDFDGNWAGDDNWEHCGSFADGDYDDPPIFPQPAYIYYSVVETATHYFIGYYDFHPRDWSAADLGFVETEHENDMEGVLLVIKKVGNGTELLCMETNAHGDFYQYEGPSQDLRDGPYAGIDGQIQLETYDGHGHPRVYVEAKGHGVYGRGKDAYQKRYWDWSGSEFPGGDGAIYYPSGRADVPDPRPEYNGPFPWSLGYALIRIDDPQVGLWSGRFGPYGPGHMFHNFYAFEGDDGEDNAAHAPWGWDDSPRWWNPFDDDGPTFAGEILYNPADMVDLHFDGVGEFSHYYTYNPYAVQVDIEYYQVLWDMDSYDDLYDVRQYYDLVTGPGSDPVLRLYMFDGKGDYTWSTFDLTWKPPFYEEHYWDGVLDGVQGKGFLGYNVPVGKGFYQSDLALKFEIQGRYGGPMRFYFYGIRYRDSQGRDRPYFGFESLDLDPSPPGVLLPPIYQWLMNDAKTHWYGPPGAVWLTQTIYDGEYTFDWGGSKIRIVVTGDVVDDDTTPPTIVRASTDPDGIIYTTYPGAIWFTADIADESGIKYAMFRYRGTTAEWSEWMTAPAVTQPVQTEHGLETRFRIGFLIGEFARLQGQTISYQWGAMDGDDDRTWRYEDGKWGSEWFVGPDIAPSITGAYPSVAGEIIAFQTSEAEFNGDLNGDGDTSDTVIRYLDTRTGEVTNTGAVGEYPTVSGGIIAFQSGSGMHYYNVSDGTTREIGVNYAGKHLSISGDIIAFEYGSPPQIRFYNLSAGTFYSTWTVGIHPAVSDNLIAFETPEGWVETDLNGDGDQDDCVIMYKNISAPGPVVNTTAVGQDPSVSDGVIAFETFEWTVGQDLNNDDDQTDCVIRYYDIETGVLHNTAVIGYHPSINHGSIAFETPESMVGENLNEDVDPPYERIIRRYCITRTKFGGAGDLTNTGLPGEYPSIAGMATAFHVNETQLRRDLNGDGDQEDCVVQYHNAIPTFLSTGLEVLEHLVGARGTRAAELAYELLLKYSRVTVPGTVTVIPIPTVTGGLGPLPLPTGRLSLPDLPSGFMFRGDALEVTTTAEYEGAVEITMPYDEALIAEEDNLRLMELDSQTMRWKDITTGIDMVNDVIQGVSPEFHSTLALVEWVGVTPPQTTGLGRFPSTDRNVIAFQTGESENDTDLNGDGDTDDTVIQYYDLCTKVTTNTGAVGEHPSVSGNIIAFQTDENVAGRDLNLDGDQNDTVIRYYDISTHTLRPDALELEWSRTYGGTGRDLSRASSRTSDGGYVIVGHTNSSGAGGYDVWLLKADASGRIQWNRTYGGTYDDYAVSVAQTSDEGYVVAGWINDPVLNELYPWLAKTDANGQMEWNQTYGERGYFWSVVPTGDGGYILTGTTYAHSAGLADVWLVKTDSTGTVAWSRNLGGTLDDNGNEVEQTGDGGYVIEANTKSFGAGNSDAWLIRTDENGTVIWNRTYGGGEDDYANSLIHTGDGGYAFAGSTSSGAGNRDFWLVKTDTTGAMLWSETYGGTEYDAALCLEQTSDGGYIVGGTTDPSGNGNRDIWLVKTDSIGNMKWDRTYGGTGFESSHSVFETSDEGYVVAGTTSSSGAGNFDAWLAKLAPPAPCGASPSTDGSTIAFYTREDWSNQDLNGDGDMSDDVIRYFNVSTRRVTSAGTTGVQPSIDRDIIAFTTYEEPYMFPYVKYYNITDATTTSTGLIGEHPVVSGDTIAFEEGPLLSYYSISATQETPMYVYGHSPSLDGSIMVFITDEYEYMVNTDLNHDGDTSDSILQYYDLASGNVTDTTCTGLNPTLSGNVIAFETPENIIGWDVNGDGDQNDSVIVYTTRVIPVTQLPPTSARILIPAPIGGTISNLAGTAAARIAPGALSTDTTLAIQQLPEDQYGSFLAQIIDDIVSTQVTEIAPSGITLAEPAEITLTYDESKVDENNLGQLQIYSSTDNVNWQQEPITSINTVHNILTFMTTHFSYFVIVRDTEPPTTQLAIGTPQQTDETGNIHVFSTTPFTLTSTDSASGPAYAYYRINNGSWNSFGEQFTLTGQAATCTIEYYGIDFAGNHETPKSASVILMNDVNATVKIAPQTLNTNSTKDWFRTYIELPEGYCVTDINVISILLNATIQVDENPPTIGDYDSDTVPDLEVQFNKTEILQYVSYKGVKFGNITLTLSGQVTDGTPFEGVLTVGVKMRGDTNLDGRVDIYDAITASLAFGSDPEDTKWNSAADENEDELVDIYDVILIARNFGKTYN